MGTEQPTAETSDDIQREIGHDEYEPIGTLVLVFIYFAILVALWVFTYYIEFLGRITPMGVF